MSVISQQVLVDLTGGGSPTTDITQWVESGQARIGRADPMKWSADGGSGTITLNNSDKRFSPENSAGPYFGQLLPMRRINVLLNGQLSFVGYVVSWTPTPGQFRDRTTTIEIIDYVAYLQATTIYSPQRLNFEGNELVAGVVNAAFGAPAYTATWTFISLPANSTTVSITYNGVTTTYKFKTTTLVNGYDVKADTIANACANLAAAINQTEGNGTTYISGTPSQNITAVATASTVVLTQQIPGATGTNFTIASGTAAVTAGATSGGVDFPSGSTSYEVGINTFPRAGQNWGAINALTAIEETTRSENGRFWVSRGGVVTWVNRNHYFLRLVVASAMTLNGNPPGVNGKISADTIFNQMLVSVNPQDLQTNSVVAKSTSVIQVPGNGSTVVKLPYVDPVTARAGMATNLTLPLVASTDWVANEKPDNSGVDYTTVITGYVTFTYVILANEIQITVKNTATGTLYLTKFQVRGQMLTSYNPVTMPKTDATSISTYKLQKAFKIDMPISTDTLYADSLGNYMLSKWSNPKFRISQINMGALNGTYGSNPPWNVNIDDVITLSENQMGVVNHKYLVIGIQVQWDAGNAIQYAFNLERIDDTTYWILQDATYGALGTTTKLAI